MSPRAACRLEALGFRYVYDYVPGKVDWLARGLPREGDDADVPRAGDLARDDVVLARLDEPMREIRPRVEHSPYGFALVASNGGTLLGRLRKAALEGDPHARAEDVMEPGPSTVRASAPLDALRERLDEGGFTTAVVTTPEGVLLGVVQRGDLR